MLEYLKSYRSVSSRAPVRGHHRPKEEAPKMNVVSSRAPVRGHHIGKGNGRVANRFQVVPP